MKLNLKILVILVAALAGCASAPRATDADRIMIFSENSYAELFEAIKAALFELNAEIVAGSKDSGFVNAKVRFDNELVTTLIIGPNRSMYTNYRLSFLAGEKEIKAQLKIIVSYDDGSHPSEAPQPQYNQFWDLVKKHLAGQ